MLGIRAASGGAEGGGGGPPFTIAGAFAGGEKGGYWDFVDPTMLAVNNDGTGGTPSIDAVVRWAVDQSPNGNHLRTNQGSGLPVRKANGLQTSGAGYGLFNTGGFGDWPTIPEPFEILCTLEQIAFAGSDARIMTPLGTNGSFLQGPSSGAMRFYSGDYGAAMDTAIGVEVTIDALFATTGRTQRVNNGAAVPLGGSVVGTVFDGLFLGASSGGGSPSAIRFKRLLIISRALTTAERNGAVAMLSA